MDTTQKLPNSCCISLLFSMVTLIYKIDFITLVCGSIENSLRIQTGFK